MNFTIFRDEIEKANKLMSLSKYQLALDAYDKLIGKFSFQDKHILAGIGMCYYQLDDNEKSLKYAADALSLDANLAVAFYLKAINHRDLGNFELQNKNINQAIELSPNKVLFLNIKVQYLLQIGENKKALDLAQKAEKLDPNNPSTMYSKCRIYLLEKDHFNYNKTVEKALELYPNDPNFHYIESYNLYQKEQYKDAIKSAKTSLEISPADQQTQELLKASEFKLENVVSYGLAIFIIIKVLLIIIKIMN